MSHHFARSISKRAAGTLTAQWPEVLALPRAASASLIELPALDQAPMRQLCISSDRPRLNAGNGKGDTGPGGQDTYRRVLVRLAGQLGLLARNARQENKLERLEGLISALRIIGAAIKDCE